MKWEPLSVMIRIACGVLALFLLGVSAILFSMISGHISEALPIIVGSVIVGGLFGAAAIFGRSPNLRELSNKERK